MGEHHPGSLIADLVAYAIYLVLALFLFVGGFVTVRAVARWALSLAAPSSEFGAWISVPGGAIDTSRVRVAAIVESKTAKPGVEILASGDAVLTIPPRGGARAIAKKIFYDDLERHPRKETRLSPLKRAAGALRVSLSTPDGEGEANTAC